MKTACTGAPRQLGDQAHRRVEGVDRPPRAACALRKQHQLPAGAQLGRRPGGPSRRASRWRCSVPAARPGPGRGCAARLAFMMQAAARQPGHQHQRVQQAGVVGDDDQARLVGQRIERPRIHLQQPAARGQAPEPGITARDGAPPEGTPALRAHQRQQHQGQQVPAQRAQAQHQQQPLQQQPGQRPQPGAGDQRRAGPAALARPGHARRAQRKFIAVSHPHAGLPQHPRDTDADTEVAAAAAPAGCRASALPASESARTKAPIQRGPSRRDSDSVACQPAWPAPARCSGRVAVARPRVRRRRSRRAGGGCPTPSRPGRRCSRADAAVVGEVGQGRPADGLRGCDCQREGRAHRQPRLELPARATRPGAG
jgi:hypothetical protein